MKKNNNKEKTEAQKEFIKLWGVFRNVVLKPAGVPLGEWDIENQCRKKK